MEKLEVKQTAMGIDLGVLRFDLGKEIAGVREASLAMTRSEIIVTLHIASSVTDPTQLAALARDIATQVQLRHPGKSVRVLSDQEEAQEIDGFDPLRGPINGGPAPR
jgi:hypothetical protein